MRVVKIVLAILRGMPECPASPDGYHCRSATGKPVCQFCGASL